MRIFEKLHSVRTYQRTHMPYLESLEDYDIVCEIGHAQEKGKAFTPSHLLACQLGSPATVRRRLTRLVKLKVVVSKPHAEDGRLVLLSLSRGTIKAYEKLQSQINPAAR